MGKMGAFELNYSSDIDLIVFFDPDAAALAPDAEPAPFFVRLTRELVKLLQERTADGYVFRVDLRLRPDPASTADRDLDRRRRSIITKAADRTGSAPRMIKARACAGDHRGRRALLHDLVALRLAQISRLRRGRRRARDEAADPCLSRPRRDRGRRPQHQARPRRHPRDRVLRADPATDRRRPPSGIARPRHVDNARRARRRRLDRRGGPRRR